MATRIIHPSGTNCNNGILPSSSVCSTPSRTFPAPFWIPCVTTHQLVVRRGHLVGSHRHRRGFHVSFEVTTLCVSLYVLDFAIGPVFLAPLSEYLGRQLVYVVSWFLLFIFSCRLPSPPTSAPSSSAVSWQVVPVWTARLEERGGGGGALKSILVRWVI